MSFDDELDSYRDDLSTTRETGSRLSADDDSDTSITTEPLPSRSSGSGGRLTVPEDSSAWRARGNRAWRFTRTLAITVLVLVGLAALGSVGIHHFPRTSTHTYTYTSVQRLLIAVDGNGSIDIKGVDGDRVTVKATDRATILDPVQRQIVSSGGWLIVSVHCPSTECSSKYEIDVPHSLSVTAMMDHSSDQADISARDLLADVQLFTGRGNITIDHLATTSNVSVTANGRVNATNVSASALDVFAPIGDQIHLGVTGDISTIRTIRITAGQPADVNISLPAGGYNFSCVPAGHCDGPNGDITQDSTGTVHQDSTSQHIVQINVVQNSAKIAAS